jgi:hypothetical protein
MAIKRHLRDEWIPLVAPDDHRALFINQQCWMTMRNATAGINATYSTRNPHHGVYVFVISGTVFINGQLLGDRDAAGWKSARQLTIQASKDACILCIEVPV